MFGIAIILAFIAWMLYVIQDELSKIRRILEKRNGKE